MNTTIAWALIGLVAVIQAGIGLELIIERAAIRAAWRRLATRRRSVWEASTRYEP